MNKLINLFSSSCIGLSLFDITLSIFSLFSSFISLLGLDTIPNENNKLCISSSVNISLLFSNASIASSYLLMKFLNSNLYVGISLTSNNLFLFFFKFF